MQPVRPFDLERNRAGKLELLAGCGYVLPPNFGGQAEKGGFGKVLAGRAEAPFSLRGNVGLLLRGECPGAEHQATTDKQGVFPESSSLLRRPVVPGPVPCQ